MPVRQRVFRYPELRQAEVLGDASAAVLLLLLRVGALLLALQMRLQRGERVSRELVQQQLLAHGHRWALLLGRLLAAAAAAAAAVATHRWPP
jgi:hypothetical protein